MADNSLLRIKYAYYHPTWDRNTQDRSILLSQAVSIVPQDFTLDMANHIYCPKCLTPLTRTPKNKEIMRNGRSASFAHLSLFRHIPCEWRTKRPEGKKYDNQEEALKAITDGQLAVIKSFILERPEKLSVLNASFDPNYLEDIEGEVSPFPIGRHVGETFMLPSKITTVYGLCRNFDENYRKYFVLPDKDVAEPLEHLLVDIQSVEDVCDSPRLYYGTILSSYSGSAPHHIRLTRLKWSKKNNYSDFYFKHNNKDASDRGITEKSRGSILVMYGKVVKNGWGLCIENLGWGEFAILPEKYKYILINRYA
ncbi:hypothetical protein ABQG65_08765 [Yersinia alsatica]|uniref:hypothetical protein n=1 Tax=Yersinia alsatica TaxID=2890317 RepID=UPI0032EB5F85